MPHKLGIRSINKLNTCHRDLQLIAEGAIGRSAVDFSITEGARSREIQKRYFESGASKLDPDDPKNKDRMKHLYIPSWAFDIAIYVAGRSDLLYDPIHLAYVAGVIMTVAGELFDEGKISHRLRWGGNWDGDGIVVKDQRFVDMPHFELVQKEEDV